MKLAEQKRAADLEAEKERAAIIAVNKQKRLKKVAAQELHERLEREKKAKYRTLPVVINVTIKHHLITACLSTGSFLQNLLELPMMKQPLSSQTMSWKLKRMLPNERKPRLMRRQQQQQPREQKLSSSRRPKQRNSRLFVLAGILVQGLEATAAKNSKRGAAKKSGASTGVVLTWIRMAKVQLAAGNLADGVRGRRSVFVESDFEKRALFKKTLLLEIFPLGLVVAPFFAKYVRDVFDALVKKQNVIHTKASEVRAASAKAITDALDQANAAVEDNVAMKARIAAQYKQISRLKDNKTVLSLQLKAAKTAADRDPALLAPVVNAAPVISNIHAGYPAAPANSALSRIALLSMEKTCAISTILAVNSNTSQQISPAHLTLILGSGRSQPEDGRRKPVAEVLARLELGQYLLAFKDAGIDFQSDLAAATDKELAALGVKPFHIKRLKEASQD